MIRDKKLVSLFPADNIFFSCELQVNWYGNWWVTSTYLPKSKVYCYNLTIAKRWHYITAARFLQNHYSTFSNIFQYSIRHSWFSTRLIGKHKPIKVFLPWLEPSQLTGLWTRCKKCRRVYSEQLTYLTYLKGAWTPTGNHNGRYFIPDTDWDWGPNYSAQWDGSSRLEAQWDRGPFILMTWR